MVTAILPSLTNDIESPRLARDADNDNRKPANHPRDSLPVPMDSQLTITPESYSQSHGTTVLVTHPDEEIGDQFEEKRGGPSALAGYVGLFTGCGALVALVLFLPLPTRFGQIQGVTLGQAVEYSFYVVGVVSFLVAAFVFFGLRALEGEEGKGWRMLLGLQRDTDHHGGDEQEQLQLFKQEVGRFCTGHFDP